LLLATGALSLAPAASAGDAPPTCQPVSDSIPQNAPASIALSCTDPSSQPQTIAITSNPSHGTLGPIDQTSPTSATVTYTPAAGYNGSDSFTFAASGVGGASAPATISLSVGWVDGYYGAGSPPGWAGPPVSTLTPGPSASAGSQGPAAPPVLSALVVRPATFSIAGRRDLKLRGSFRLSQPASVTFTLERVTAGRREGGRCVAATGANHTRPRCSRRVRLPGSTTRDALAGTDTFTVTGSLRGIALTPGSYELVATPVSGGVSGNAETAGFSITR